MRNEEELGREMYYSCFECKVIDPSTFDPGYEYIYWTLRVGGNELKFGDVSITLSSSFIPCIKHNAILHERYAEDNGLPTQNIPNVAGEDHSEY